jgi:hypothetical protein
VERRLLGCKAAIPTRSEARPRHHAAEGLEGGARQSGAQAQEARQRRASSSYRAKAIHAAHEAPQLRFPGQQQASRRRRAQTAAAACARRTAE